MSVWTRSHGQYKADAYYLWKHGEVTERGKALADGTHLNIKIPTTVGPESLSFNVIPDGNFKKVGPRVNYVLLDIEYAPRVVKTFFDTHLIEDNFNPISNHPGTPAQCTFKESIEAQYKLLFEKEQFRSVDPLCL